MPTLNVLYNPQTRVATVQTGTAAVAGSTNIGTFTHPDATYPDSSVIYQGVRDLLYKRSASDITKTASFPNNITDMALVSIKFTGSIPVTRIVLNVDAVNLNVGKTEAVRADVYPEVATNKVVAWTIGDATVATATANGDNAVVIKALKLGDTTLTGKDSSGTVVVSIPVNVGESAS